MILSRFWHTLGYSINYADILLSSMFLLILLHLVVPYHSEMSAYDNVVGGKLKLKGKALDVKAGGIKKKKKQKHHRQGEDPHVEREEVPQGLLSTL